MAIAMQPLGIRQSKAETFCFRVDGTGTAAISEGKYHGTLTDNGTGDYTITFDRPFRRVPVVTVGLETAAVRHELSSISTTAVRIKTFGYNNTTATDAKFHLIVVGFFSATER